MHSKDAGKVLVSISEYARQRGVTPPAVHKAIKDGRLRKAISRDARDRPRVDVALANQEWEQRTDPSRKRSAAAIRAGKKAMQPAPLFDAAAEKSSSGDGGTEARSQLGESLQLARATREAAVARMAQISLAQREGLLVPVADIEKAAIKAAKTVQNAVLAVPARVCDELATITDSRGVYDLLVRELREALKAASMAMEPTNGHDSSRR